MKDADVAKAIALLKQISEDAAAIKRDIAAMKALVSDSAHTQLQAGEMVTMIQVKAR